MLSSDLKNILNELSRTQKKMKCGLNEYVSPYELSAQEKSELLEWAQKTIQHSFYSPSNGNFQPTKAVVVQTQHAKELLFKACFHDHLIANSICTIVVLSDKKAVFEHARDVLEDDFARGAIAAKEAQALRILLDMGYSTKPFGLGRLLKQILIPCARLFMKIPEIPIVNYRSWLYKQAGIVTGVFLQAAHFHQTVHAKICEWYDEKSVLRALSLSKTDYYVPFIITVGISKDSIKNERSTLEIDSLISYR